MRAGVSSPSTVSIRRVSSNADHQDQRATIKKEAGRAQGQGASEACADADAARIPPPPRACGDEVAGFSAWDATVRRRATYRVLFGQPLLSAKQRRANVPVHASDAAEVDAAATTTAVKQEPLGALTLPLAGGRRRNSLELLGALDADSALLLGDKTALESEDAGEDAILSEFPPVLELAAGELEDGDDLLLMAVGADESTADASALGKRSVSTAKAGAAAALTDAFTSRSGDRHADRSDPLALELAQPEDLDEILRLIDANDALSPAVKRPAARKPRQPRKEPVQAVEGVSLAF